MNLLAQNYKTNLKQNIRIIWSGISLMTDYLAILLAEMIAMYFSEENLRYIDLFIVIPFIYIAFIAAARTYRRTIPFWQRVESLFYSSIYSIIAILLFFFVSANSTEHSIAFLALLWLASFICLIIVRYLLKRILDERKIFKIPLLIIGAQEEALAFTRSINNDIGMSSYKIVGLISDKTPIKGLEKYPLLGDFKDIEEIIKTTGINNVLIAIPYLEQVKMQNIIHRVQPLVKNICIIPNLTAIPMGGGIDVETFFTEKIMLIRVRNNLERRLNRIIKYLFDMILTIVGTICISPLLVIIAIWIYKDSPGPVIFKHMRVGKDGKEFPCYKFRSMCVDAKEKLEELLQNDPEARAEWERDFKLKHDPRITKSGAFLRKTSLDELPQIFNVLKGEMSLVGPRPIIKAEMQRYGNYINDYLMVRPGIAGMWQCSGRNDVDYTERVHMDSWYVRNWSVWLDIMILWRTFKAVFAKRGAY